MCLLDPYKNNFLEKINMLGGDVSFKVKDKFRFTGPLGGVLSLILVFCYLSLISVFIIPFMRRFNPRVVFQNVKVEHATEWNLGKKDFFIGFKLELAGHNITTMNDIFKFEVSFIDQRISDNGTLTQKSKTLGYQKLSIDEFDGNEFLFLSQGLDQSYRVIFDNSTVMQGASISHIYTYLKIKIKLLNYTTESIQKLSKLKGNLKIFYSDYSLSLRNLTEPAYTFYSFYSDNLLLDKSKKLVLDFSVVNVTTDLGYLFEENVDTHLGIQHYTTVQTDQIIADGLLYDINFKLSKYCPNYYRTYMKIPELLANIGGVLSIILNMFLFFNIFIENFNIHTTVIESLFDLDENYLDGDTEMKKMKRHTKLRDSNLNVNENTKQKRLPNNSVGTSMQFSNVKDTQNKNLMNTKGNSGKNNDHKKEENLDAEDSLLQEIISPSIIRKPVFFNGKDAFIHIFCKCFRKTRKLELYEKAKKAAHHYMDYVTVVRRGMEFDIFKFLVLSKEQNLVYNMIKRPLISLKPQAQDSKVNNKLSDNIFIYTDSFPMSTNEIKNLPLEKKKLLKSSYDKIACKDKLSIIDKKIIKSIDDHTLELLENDFS